MTSVAVAGFPRIYLATCVVFACTSSASVRGADAERVASLFSGDSKGLEETELLGLDKQSIHVRTR